MIRQIFAYDEVQATLANQLISAQASGGTNGIYATETYTYTATTGNIYSKAGVTYYYTDSNHAHAVTSLSNNNTYSYDANGNQTSRTISGTAYTLSYDAENRLVSVTWSGSNRMEFTFDGDGNRVKSVLNTSTTTTFVGTYYEVTGSAITKYYYAGTMRVAMHTSSGVRYIFGDHLGSTSITADINGTNSVRQLYKAWGEVRYSSGSLPTKYAYTGQYSYASAGEIGLLYYVARFYDPVLGRYSSPDSIIPIESQGVQAWDRFAYVNNSPVVSKDPSGHCSETPGDDDIRCWHLAKKIFDEFGHPYEELILWNEDQLYKLLDAYQNLPPPDKLSKQMIDLITPEEGTFSFGISGTGGGALFVYGGITIISIDSLGNIAIPSITIGGGGLLPVAAEGAFFFSWTDAQNINQLAGWSTSIGGSMELGVSVGYDGIFFSDPITGQKYKGGTLSLGGGGGVIAEGHVGVNYTWNLYKNNLYHLFGLEIPSKSE